MHRRIVWLVALVLALGVAASAAGAKSGGTKHKRTATIRLATISTSATFPAVGSSIQDAGTVRAKPEGKGAATALIRVTQPLTNGSITLVGTADVFFALGSQTGKVTVHATMGPSGTTYTGGGKFLRGTGIYKHVSGKFTFTGSAPTGATVTTLHVKGTVRY
jgi:hypothetical protein